jgi:hypothetical protein
MHSTMPRRAVGCSRAGPPFTNWRLTLIQVLPAMWIWAAIFDLKAHVLHGRTFHVLTGPVVIPLMLAVALITAASFYLNAVSAYAIAVPGPASDPADSARARAHRTITLGWGFAVGVLLGLSVIVMGVVPGTTPCRAQDPNSLALAAANSSSVSTPC